jgi:hypothetical protein
MKIQESGLEHLNLTQQAAVKQTLDVWSKVLLDRLPHPARHEQHLLLFDAVTKNSTDELPANINRYIFRTVGMDVIRSESTTFVFTKMGKFIVLGFIDVRHLRQWVGTKIHIREGMVGAGSYTVPIQLRDYIVDKAKRYASLVASISDTQQAKIAEAAWKDLDRVALSGTFDAMQNDVELSGQAAFDIHKPKE